MRRAIDTKSFAIAALLLTAACRTNTPATAYYDASDYYATTLEKLTTIRQAGGMSKRTHERIKPVAIAVDAALDKWFEELQNADPETGEVNVPEVVKAAVREGMNQLAIYLAQHTERK